MDDYENRTVRYLRRQRAPEEIGALNNPHLLIIGRDEEAAIQALLARGRAKRRTEVALLAQTRGVIDPPGADPESVLQLPVGWRCVYTEDQTRSGGWVRHLSVSVGHRDAPHGLPRPEAEWPPAAGVAMIARAFGFQLSDAAPPDCFKAVDAIWPEEGCRAVNLVQYIDPADRERVRRGGA